MKNVEASIRARLTQKAKERGITFQYASILYMQEGLLPRIAGSAYARKLILKGGFLLFANQQAAGRTTKDIDFLGDGIPNDPQALAKIFAAWCPGSTGMAFHSMETRFGPSASRRGQTTTGCACT
jgi:hypothetical protein